MAALANKGEEQKMSIAAALHQHVEKEFDECWLSWWTLYSSFGGTIEEYGREGWPAVSSVVCAETTRATAGELKKHVERAEAPKLFVGCN
jgi:hypothetical protein